MTRRDFALLLPALAVSGESRPDTTLASGFFRHAELPVRTRASSRLRPILNGALRSGFAVELHESELAPGTAPHPPHHHPHEEVLVVQEGTLEVTIAGKSTALDVGSVAFIASDEEHGWRNVGSGPARYLIFALGPDRAYRDNMARPD